jgi:hypothetical protein
VPGMLEQILEAKAIRCVEECDLSARVRGVSKENARKTGHERNEESLTRRAKRGGDANFE